jgi:signal transduction histidine kinase
MKISLVDKRLRVVEKLAYALILLPFLDDLLEHGHLDLTLRESGTEVALALLIAAFVYVLHKVRVRLVNVEESRAQLTQMMLHDVKNPLSAAMGAISFLMEDPGDEQKQHSLLKVALSNCRVAIRLMEQVLEIERLEAAELAPKKRPMEIPALLRACADEIAGSAALAAVQVSCAANAGLPEVPADPELLGRVITNLLQNALKYTPQGGRITLRATRASGVVRLEVSDTGRGIPPEELPKLFNKYYRVQGDAPSAYRGTGLGLYFCKLAVEAHGGQIGIRSEPGKGTTVTLSLPLTSSN